jgi:hypothetical protein
MSANISEVCLLKNMNAVAWGEFIETCLKRLSQMQKGSLMRKGSFPTTRFHLAVFVSTVIGFFG